MVSLRKRRGNCGIVIIIVLLLLILMALIL
jgi:Tfp pilus assembly protein PilX